MALFRSRGHYENFPVASVFLPRAMRRHVAAVYAFARTADDFADEGSLAPAERLRLLEGWRDRLRHAAQNAAPGGPPGPGEPPDTVRLFLALRATIEEKAIPVGLFEDLLGAFTQDVTVTRYDTWSDLLDYCRRSANPVGRIVLRIADCHDPALDAWSDSICTALQLTNFWQDVPIDLARGRLYVPAEAIRAAGVPEREIAEGLAPAWRPVLARAVHRTRAGFDAGRPLCDALTGRLRYEVRATWLGGTRILDRIEAGRYDVFAHRPVLGGRDVPWLAWRLLAWPSGPRPSARSDKVGRT